jgi:acetyl esterase/lipase
MLAMGIAFSSWIALAAYHFKGVQAKPVMENAIQEALGENYMDIIPKERAAGFSYDVTLADIANPFAYKDPEVKVHKNIRYGFEDGEKLFLDVYHHRNTPQDAPVIFMVHGGAWLEKMGNKNQQALILMKTLAKRGWVCVTVDYRLSPTHTWPAHIIDVKAALKWTKENVANYGGDPDFIIATGGSAGGHLSSLLTLSANDPAYQPGFEDTDTSVQGCVPFYGIYDLTNSSNQRGSMRTLEDLWEQKVFKESLFDKPEEYHAASPVFRVTKDAPPFLLIHGNNDTLAKVEESYALRDALKTVEGLEIGFAEIDGAQHAFDLMVSPRHLHVVNGIERFATALHERYLKAKQS